MIGRLSSFKYARPHGLDDLSIKTTVKRFETAESFRGIEREREREREREAVRMMTVLQRFKVLTHLMRKIMKKEERVEISACSDSRASGPQLQISSSSVFRPAELSN